ncbi:hypothetical protein M9194_07805 [Vibrio sp. S4M6]|uniref:hypothetical protein n=1 Tax=Vibrio sinus TaxID=2946865 RepID=UPI00202A82B8|nr:hypothetical protein [Vibrio sinus]MCL9781329.1 hypothetical protein [Vibrio sinus]
MKFVSFLFALFSSIIFANPLPNDEKLISSLIERGVICGNQTFEENQKSLQIYLSKRFNKNNKADKSNNTSNKNDTTTNKQCISASKK